jgi:hypothetical protein
VLFCTSVATHQCIICGRFFCEKHGDVDGPHCWRCKAGFMRKLEAEETAQIELVRREIAAQNNAAGSCGWAGCDNPKLILCQRCGLYYCGLHCNSFRYSYRFRSRKGVETRRAVVTLCDACKAHLREYKREKTWLDV